MIEPLDGRIIVVVDCMCVEQFSSVVGIVSKFLQPDWKPVLVQTLSNELGISAIGRLDIGHIVIVSGEAGPYVDSGWAAD